MPSFDAGSVVEPIHLRLLPYADFDADVREPSDKQLGEFLAGLKRLMRGGMASMGVTGEVDTRDPEATIRALDELEPEKFVEVMSELADLHSKLCSGKPTKAQILAVPVPRRMLLFAFLQGEVMSPEPVPADGGPQLHSLPRAAGQ
jgi:hypothetical protein